MVVCQDCPDYNSIFQQHSHERQTQIKELLQIKGAWDMVITYNLWSWLRSNARKTESVVTDKSESKLKIPENYCVNVNFTSFEICIAVT